ncbi:hypothetical protein BC940DRAFT_288272 [Gongronella butleri]|nr:hypothetical protein BC940DRAFT_288272 [Gongronella butleri]
MTPPFLLSHGVTAPPRLDNSQIMVLGKTTAVLPTAAAKSVDNDAPPSPHSMLMRPSSALSSSSAAIHITGYGIPSTFMIPMVHRDVEMEAIVQHNREFFDAIAHQLAPTAAGKQWDRLLFTTRHDLHDDQWLGAIEHLLQTNLPASSSLAQFQHFQALIGHLPNESPATQHSFQPEHHDVALYQSNQSLHHHPPNAFFIDYFSSTTSRSASSTAPSSYQASRSSSFASSSPFPMGDLAPIDETPDENAHPSVAAVFAAAAAAPETAKLVPAPKDLGKEQDAYFFDPTVRSARHWEVYPQAWLAQCERDMQLSDFAMLCRTLFAPPDDVDNDAWETNLYRCLNPYPRLFLTLKDLIDTYLQK